MKRSALDQVARDHGLSETAISAALDLTGCRPDAAAWRAFGARLMNATGIAALGAGIIFFVAANWQDYGVFGRFALLQIAFAGCVGVAAWRPPPSALAAAALVLATLLAGGLLALFGQSYQTGADVYELFFAWAALALPLALAGRSGAVWATWWIVLNVGLALFCGWLGPNHFMWSWLDHRGIAKPLMLLVPCAVNLGGAALFQHLGHTKLASHAPRWLVRLLLAFGFVYGTAASIMAITGSPSHSGADGFTQQDALVVALFAAASAAIAALTLKRKRDVFPMAAIIGSWIAIATVVLVKGMKISDLGSIFVVALWLIGSSAAASYVLMHWVRTWRFDDEDDEAPEASA
jgi:uncharacterized membrane protein